MSLSLLIGLTLLTVLYLLLNRFAGKRISARTRYFAGLILLVAFLFPIRIPLFHIPMPAFMETRGEAGITVTVRTSRGEDGVEISEEGLPDKLEASKTQISSALRALGLTVYLCGVFLSLFLTWRRHHAIRKTLRRATVTPPESLAWQFDMLCGKIGFHTKPRLLVCRASVASALGAPFTFGVFRRYVVVPDDLVGEDAEMLLMHELCHCKRRDALFRLILSVVSALYWFYLPILPFVRTLFSVCEEACDEQVTADQSGEERAAYGKLLIRYASKGALLPVSFGSTGKKLRQRIETLFTEKHRRESYVVITLTAYLVCLVMGTSFSAPINKVVVDRGSECFHHRSDAVEDGLHTMYEEMLHALSQTDRLSLISRCRYSTKAGELTYTATDRLCYADRLIATVIVESRDSTEFSAVSTYCDGRYAESCVGIRLIYKGERTDDGAMEYTHVSLLSDRELLDYYVWLLLPQENRGETFYDMPAYNTDKGWQERVITMAQQKDSSLVPFYRALIERVS